VIAKSAWTLFLESWNQQKQLEKKRREFQNLTSSNLEYSMLEQITRAAAAQQPGFFSEITFPGGAVWKFGVREGSKPAPRKPNEMY
jgi:hypothetical protein